MDSIDMAHAERRARVRYEWSRAKWAILGFAPVLIIVAIAVAFGHRPAWSVTFGLTMFAAGALMLWYGRDLKRAVLPGVAAGVLPLVLVVCANHVGHVCTGDSCMMVCLPACVVGGSLAGLAVASIGIRRRAGALFWLSASGLALLTGAMGCACAGYPGVVGLAIGYGAGTLPGLLRKALGSQAS
jgi:hypothetical protein